MTQAMCRRNTEIQQYGNALLGHVDIGGLDILVDDTFLMDVLECVHQRQHQCLCLFAVQGAVGFEQMMQWLPLVIGHQEIGGAVGLKIAQYLDDIRMIECRNDTRFVQKQFEATARKSSADCSSFGATLPSSCRCDIFGGQVLFECKAGADGRVGHQVSDTKGTNTEDRIDLKVADHANRVEVLMTELSCPFRLLSDHADCQFNITQEYFIVLLDKQNLPRQTGDITDKAAISGAEIGKASAFPHRIQYVHGRG